MKVILLFIFFLTNAFSFTIYEDTTNSLLPQEIINQKNIFLSTDKNSLGYTKNTLWLKFDLENKSDVEIDKYILFTFPLLNTIDMYYLDNKKLIQESTGSNIETKEKEFNYIQPIFKIKLKAQEEKIIYIKIISSSHSNFSHFIFDDKDLLIEHLVTYQSLKVFIFGMILILLLLMVLLIMFNRDITNILYFILLSLTLMTQLFMSGYAQYIYSFDNNSLYSELLLNLLIITIFFFLIQILQIKKNIPQLINIFYLFIAIFFFFFLFENFNINQIDTVKTEIIIPMAMFFILLTITYSIFKKIQFSLFLLVGWSFYLAGGFILNAQNIGDININHSFLYWQIGSLLEAIVFFTMLIYRVKLLNDKKIENEKKLILNEKMIQRQAKFATIGETLSSIEHQWRAPLSKISSNVVNLQGHLEFKGLPSKEHLELSLNNINNTLQYMTNLVDEFKNFYMKDKERVEFDCKESLYSALNLLDHNIKKYNIKITQNIEPSNKIVGYPNEFTQVILNIISNAVDILVQREIGNPKIDIKIYMKDENIILSIMDNAGGVDEGNISKLFDKFYSNKQQVSTGLGLYLAKDIIENRMDGKINVYNTDNGLKFLLTFSRL